MNVIEKRNHAKALIATLRYLVKDKGLYQKVLAKEMKIDYVTLNRWFNGHQCPTSDGAIAALSKAIHKHQ